MAIFGPKKGGPDPPGDPPRGPPGLVAIELPVGDKRSASIKKSEKSLYFFASLTFCFSAAKDLFCQHHLTGVFLAPYRTWEKNPILEPRAIGYRTGPKNGVFFPMAVKRHRRHRKKVCLSFLLPAATATESRKDKHTRIT